MSNKRVIARQEKQKKQRNRNLAIGITAVCVLAIVGVFVGYGINSYNNGIIMTYEGEKIGVPDFQFSVLASSGAEDVKDAGLNQLLDSLTLLRHAEEEAVTLTEAENTDLDAYVSNFKTLFGQTYGIDFSFIGDDRIKALLSTDTLYGHLMEKHTAGYAVDETDYAAQLADYKENSKHRYYNISFKSISVATQEEMDEVVANLETRPFDDVWKEFDSSYTEGSEIAVLDLKNYALPEDLTAEMLGLKVGERTAPYAMSESSFSIFEIVSYEIPPQAEVEENFRANYTAEQKNLQFREILDGWVAEAKYTLNQKAYDDFVA